MTRRLVKRTLGAHAFASCHKRTAEEEALAWRAIGFGVLSAPRDAVRFEKLLRRAMLTVSRSSQKLSTARETLVRRSAIFIWFFLVDRGSKEDALDD